MQIESFSLLITTPGPSRIFTHHNIHMKISSENPGTSTSPIGWSVVDVEVFRPLCESDTLALGVLPPHLFLMSSSFALRHVMATLVC